jgi:uncharacterized membrane protein affecting hemolysin expression
MVQNNEQKPKLTPLQEKVCEMVAQIICVVLVLFVVNCQIERCSERLDAQNAKQMDELQKTLLNTFEMEQKGIDGILKKNFEKK